MEIDFTAGLDGTGDGDTVGRRPRVGPRLPIIADDIRLDSDSHAVAQGTVLGRSKTSMQENKRYVYEYQFSFTTEDGQQHHGMCYKTASGPNQGHAVQIRYLPHNPQVSKIQGCRLSKFGWGGVFVVIFPLLGVIMTVFVLRIRAQKIALLRDGVFSSGLITGVDVTNVTVNHQRRYKVTVSFDDDEGVQHDSVYYAYGQDVFTAQSKCDSRATVGLLYRKDNPSKILLADTLVA